jgi:hypothetical protein
MLVAFLFCGNPTVDELGDRRQAIARYWFRNPVAGPRLPRPHWYRILSCELNPRRERPAKGELDSGPFTPD